MTLQAYLGRSVGFAYFLLIIAFQCIPLGVCDHLLLMSLVLAYLTLVFSCLSYYKPFRNQNLISSLKAYLLSQKAPRELILQFQKSCLCKICLLVSVC